MIRELDVAVLRDTIAPLLPEINYTIPPDVLAALGEAAAREESDLGLPVAVNLGCHSMRRTSVSL